MSSAYFISLLRIAVDGTDLDGAVGGGRDAGGPLERVVQRGAVEDEEAAERLLHLGVRAVADELVAVADPHGGRRRGRPELVAGDEHARRPRCVRELAVLLAGTLLLRFRHPFPPGLVRV